VLLNAESGDGLFNLIIVTNRAMNDPKSSLFFEHFVAPEPAFEFVPAGTDEIENDHGSITLYKSYFTSFIRRRPAASFHSFIGGPQGFIGL
jgi:hypothetical protein